MEKWSKLDSTANLFPAVTTTHNSSVFRVAALLRDPVEPVALQQAADIIRRRFSPLFARMRTGVFWNYFEENDEPFSIQPEQEPPCANIYPVQNRGYFLRVLYGGHRVSVEVFHALTDGSGAIELLKSLLYEYCSLRYCPLPSAEGILTGETLPAPYWEDSFLKYFSHSKTGMTSSLHPAPNAFRLRGTPLPASGNRVLCGVLSAHALQQAAKSRDATITAYLSAVMAAAIARAFPDSSSKPRPVVITVPVNLRRRFPSCTLRNFFGVVNITCPFAEANDPENSVKKLNRQLAEGTSLESLQQLSAENLALTRSPVSRSVPLLLKDLFVPLGFHMMGESKKTITISNLGKVSLPKELEVFLLHLECVLYPTAKSPLNCGIVSVGDRLTISFSQTIQETDVPREFFRLLAGEMDVSVYDNDWGKTT